MNKADSLTQISSLLEPAWQKIHQPLLLELNSEFNKWLLKQEKSYLGDNNINDYIHWIQFLQSNIRQQISKIDIYNDAKNRFKSDFKHAVDAAERKQHLVNYAAKLNYTRSTIKQIINNPMGWTDEHALNDKQIKLVSNIELDIAVSIELLGKFIDLLLNQASNEQHEDFWKIISLPTFLTDLINYKSHNGISIAALKCLRVSLAKVDPSVLKRVPTELTQYIYRLCLDQSTHIWQRSEAIALIVQLQPSNIDTILKSIFEEDNKSDIFLKGRVVKHIFSNIADDKVKTYSKVFFLDMSEYVRQQTVRTLIHFKPGIAIDILQDVVNRERSEKVRGTIYYELNKVITRDKIQLSKIIEYFYRALERENGELALTILLNSFSDLAQSHVSISLWEEYLASFQQMQSKLSEIHLTHPSTAIRRAAAICIQKLSSLSNKELLSNDILKVLNKLPLGKTIVIKLNSNQDAEEICHFIQARISHRHGFNIKISNRYIKVTAGFKFKFRLWRFIYEFLNTATDKRQNHNHVKGRVYYALDHITTKKNAEQSKTKVPGEPLYHDAEIGDRDYLPLLDQVLSCLDQGWPTKPMRLYSSEGITEITPPSNFFKRLKARSIIQLKFSEIAKQRNWKEGQQTAPNAYMSTLESLGFNLRIKGYRTQNSHMKEERGRIDDRVARFFPSFIPFSLPSFSEVQTYFYSVYQNTIHQLLAFILIVLGYFVGQHIILLRSFKKWRSKIPLVIGGWGTRGKSGTERLKAALFNAMGLSVMSKTTGCEAMFLYGSPNRPMKELFLFRPYDKATIWEQVFLTKLAGQLNTKVFLWECMGLTPRYIDILQNQWMHDDISTITNCYPDHEDLQGPAGIEIPIVMQRFISNKSKVFTTEDSMFPILQDAAFEKGAELNQVNLAECNLISDDVVSRFPYEEHPNNIALVMRMAEALGIENDFALQAMADNVVADLGVLKIYPVAEVNQRKLKFINGMSANERLGALGNWNRTGFNQHTLNKTPEVFTSIVINNRADRIARSKVFADMLVLDTQADSYVLIGANLAGFVNYVKESWDKHYSEENFKGNQVSTELALSLAQKYRIYTNLDDLKARIDAAIKGTNLTPTTKQVLNDAIAKLFDLDDNPVVNPSNSNKTELHQLVAEDFGLSSDSINTINKNELELCNKIYTDAFYWNLELNEFLQLSKGLTQENFTQYANWLFKCFKRRFIVINDYYSSGNKTLERIIEHSLPGVETKIIGMQNIKGTGLDFIYRWQAWDQVYQWCEQLKQDSRPHVLNDAASALNAWQDYGILDFESVFECIQIAKARNVTQNELLQAELQSIYQKLTSYQDELKAELSGDQVNSKWLVSVVNFIEAFLDSGSAVSRRKKSNKIYAAILNNTISYDRASIELAKLTKQQKGGWLMQTLSSKLR
ncbi:hypothetical protein ACUR5C_08390 [Aliikangiella sp. IMCC44653]